MTMANPDFKLTYQDYLRSLPQGSESGGTGAMPEEQWNALSPSGKVQSIVGGLQLRPDDPRYAGLKALVGGEAGRGIQINPGAFDPANKNNHGTTLLKDPKAIYQGDGFYATSEDNATPEAQKSNFEPWKVVGAAAAPFLANAAVGAMGLEGGAGGLVGPPASSMGFDFSPMAPLEGGSGVGSLGADFVPSGGSGLGSLGAASSGGAGELTGPPASAMNLGTEPMASLPNASVPSLPGSSSSLLSRAGQWAMNNPGTLARAGLGLASLGAASHGSGSGSSGGSNTDASSIIEQMAHANRVNQKTPLGSRTWHQDANGQWSVEDTMDPAELANFQNVQGLNASMTGGARERLAALLAQGPRPAADRPINIAGFHIGG
jgi:hypothetical protein